MNELKEYLHYLCYFNFVLFLDCMNMHNLNTLASSL